MVRRFSCILDITSLSLGNGGKHSREPSLFPFLNSWHRARHNSVELSCPKIHTYHRATQASNLLSHVHTRSHQSLSLLRRSAFGSDCFLPSLARSSASFPARTAHITSLLGCCSHSVCSFQNAVIAAPRSFYVPYVPSSHIRATYAALNTASGSRNTTPFRRSSYDNHAGS